MENDKEQLKKYKLAFICTGNTCRSPMAQFILKYKLNKSGIKNVLVRSFGLKAKCSPINPYAESALKKLKIPLTKFVSKPLPKNVSTFDVIICMEAAHKEQLKSKNESVYTLGELCGFGDVADPYMQGERAYDEVAELFNEKLDIIVDFFRRLNDEDSDR